MTKLGLEGDQKADLKVHGGPEKALHQYPLQHYEVWASEMGQNPTVFRAGGFGENLAISGPHEDSVFIADVFRVGTATIQGDTRANAMLEAESLHGNTEHGS